MVLMALGSLFHSLGPAQLNDLAAKVLSFVSVLPVFSPDVDSLDLAFSVHMDILPKDCSNILEPLMLNIYGLVLKFVLYSSSNW